MARTRIVQITNRTTEPLDVMYDGAPDVIPAGYMVAADGETIIGAGLTPEGQPARLTYPVEYFAAEAYKRQHPCMGTQDPNSVDARDTEYLLGVEEWGDDVSSLEQSGADELIDRSKLPFNRQIAQVVDLEVGARDAKGRKAKRESRKALAKKKAIAKAGRRSAFMATDAKLKNPTGMRIEGQLD